MAHRNGLTAEQVIDALKKHQGFVSIAADELGYTTQRIYQIIKEKPTVKEALNHIREKRNDYVEGKMLKKIEAGDTAMIIFFAKTQMKDRGYVERQELEHKGEVSLPVTMVEIVRPEGKE